jgi:3-oxoacyl-[acyl-carrier-protein] synthase-3
LIERNRDFGILTGEEKEKLVASIGVEEKRVADVHTCTSDLCFMAAERLLADLGWEREEIEILVFVSQSPDYILPATACILQDRLGLSQECYAVDLSLGCSGWVYGLSAIASVMSAGRMKKGLLLVGDTTTKLGSAEDKTVRPLFGDAGTATALVYSENTRGMTFHTATDGSGKDAIIIPDGGYRNMVNNNSLSYESTGGGFSGTACTAVWTGWMSFPLPSRRCRKASRKCWSWPA